MTRLLYIHGIEGHGKESEWTQALNRGLVATGRPSLEFVPVAPDYSSILKAEPPSDVELPVSTFVRLDEDERIWLHREYARRAAWLARLAGEWPSAPIWRPPIPEPVQNVALRVFPTALAYAEDERRRACVLRSFAASIEADPDELVIVAHSLGSIIAVDLLYLLPVGTKVRLLLTAGSPLAIEAINADLPRFDKGKGFPYDRVEAWINIVEPRDFVTNGRGLSYRYPECFDVFVNSAEDSPHSAVGYFGQPVVGEVLGDVVYGSKTTAVAVVEKMPEPVPTKEQLVFLLRLQYAKRLEFAIAGDDRRRRFGEARALLLDASEQAMASGGPSALGGTEPPAVPRILRELHHDLAERLRGRFPPLEALTLLLLLAMSWPLDPYDISTEDTEKCSALRNVLDDLDLKSDWADHVFAAIRDAEDAHRRNTQTWKKVGGGTAIVFGAAAVIAAPFLIVPFAAAGTAGAAAMTSGLAGIGALVNGGMAAGIVAIAGVAAGGGRAAATGAAIVASGTQETSAAVQFASSARLIAEASPTEFAATVVQVQSLALLRNRLDLADTRYAEWFLLATVQAHVAEMRNRIEPVSDKKASAVTQWRRKQETIDRTLNWMRDQALGPPELTDPSTVANADGNGSVIERVTKELDNMRRR